MIDHPFDAVDEAALRLRRSAKWALYPPDVLPAWVAEMDYPIAAPIRRVLIEAIDRGDAGYASGAGLGEAFASWAAAHWQWEVDPAHVHLVADVVTGITELLRVATAPGDAVVIEPPVYPPFAGTVRALGRRVVEAPLLRSERGEPGWAPDLAAIERAYAGGAKVHLLCSPQNPTGIVYSRDLLVPSPHWRSATACWYWPTRSTRRWFFPARRTCRSPACRTRRGARASSSRRPRRRGTWRGSRRRR